MPSESDFQLEMERVMSGGTAIPSSSSGTGTVTHGDQSVVKKLEEIEKNTRAVQQQQQGGQALLSQLMADPEIAAVLRMKQAGRSVKVLDAEEVTKPTEPQPEPKLDPNETDPQKIIAYHMKQMMGEVKQTVASQLAPINQKLSQFDNIVQNQKVENISQQLEKLRSENSDVDNYLSTMAEINRQTGEQLPVKELYILAKARNGGVSTNRQSSTESERPTTEASRPSVFQNLQLPGGKAGMNQILAMGTRAIKGS